MPTETTSPTTDVRHPEIRVKLTGTDGNAFAVLGAVLGAMKRAKLSPKERAEFSADAMSGDYDHLLQTVRGWVTVS